MLARACASASRRDRVTQAMVGDLLTYLPGDLLVKVDLASMGHSLECRAPFLDHRVVELAAAMPLDRKLRYRPGRSKVVLKRAFADLLPPPIRIRRKMGFGVPVGRWFQSELKDELHAILFDPACQGRGLFRPEAVRDLVADHVEGRREHGHQLWALVMLELWFRNHLDRGG
ncbi:MAG: asparagine synthase C-terminal domain-containing protein [Isosphaeraceae bacterium]